jgi:hypothetical protein
MARYLSVTLATVLTSSHRNYTTVPQPGLGGRSGYYPTGIHSYVSVYRLELIKIQAEFLAGLVRSVRIHPIIHHQAEVLSDCLAYYRGSIDEWDGYASIANDTSLRWEAMVKYMARHEHFSFPDTNRNIVSWFRIIPFRQSTQLILDRRVHPFCSLQVWSSWSYTSVLERVPR